MAAFGAARTLPQDLAKKKKERKKLDEAKRAAAVSRSARSLRPFKRE